MLHRGFRWDGNPLFIEICQDPNEPSLFLHQYSQCEESQTCPNPRCILFSVLRCATTDLQGLLHLVNREFAVEDIPRDQKKLEIPSPSLRLRQSISSRHLLDLKQGIPSHLGIAPVRCLYPTLQLILTVRRQPNQTPHTWHSVPPVKL